MDQNLKLLLILIIDTPPQTVVIVLLLAGVTAGVNLVEGEAGVEVEEVDLTTMIIILLIIGEMIILKELLVAISSNNKKALRFKTEMLVDNLVVIKNKV